jgi:hypothetical protein
LKNTVQRLKKKRNILYTVKRRTPNWIDKILCRNCLLRHVIEGKIEEKARRKGKQLLGDLQEKNNVSETERGSTRSHSPETSLWKRLRTCCKTNYVVVLVIKFGHFR